MAYECFKHSLRERMRLRFALVAFALEHLPPPLQFDFTQHRVSCLINDPDKMRVKRKESLHSVAVGSGNKTASHGKIGCQSRETILCLLREHDQSPFV